MCKSLLATRAISILVKPMLILQLVRHKLWASQILFLQWRCPDNIAGLLAKDALRRRWGVAGLLAKDALRRRWRAICVVPCTMKALSRMTHKGLHLRATHHKGRCRQWAHSARGHGKGAAPPLGENDRGQENGSCTEMQVPNFSP